MSQDPDRFAISRRGFLRGVGAGLALPFLQSWSPFGSVQAAEARHPLRLLFVFVPNGMHMPSWTPKKVGEGYELPATLAPLKEHRKDFNVLSGLALDAARAHGDGPGDHARAAATFLTGMHPHKTGGADIKVGLSVDQAAAKFLGKGSRFASLELGIERSRLSGSCDSGYSCAYSSNISWRSERTPNAKEISPRRVFDRLFKSLGDGMTAKERAERRKTRASILDAVLGEARKLTGKLGTSDRRKLREYMESVREVEKRIQSTTKEASPAKGFKTPSRIPRDLGAHIESMYDLIRLAFQTDSTRVITFMVGNGGSNRNYRFLGVREGHHRLSHHGRDAKKQEKIAKINQFHVERFAYFLKEMKKVKEGSGTLLDNTLIVFGSAIGDGNRHNHDDLPILLAGSGGGRVKPGRHLLYKGQTPLCRLYYSLLQHAGWRGRHFGDATRGLPKLS